MEWDHFRYAVLRIDAMSPVERTELHEVMERFEVRFTVAEKAQADFRAEVKTDIASMRRDLVEIKTLADQAGGILRLIKFVGLPGMAAIVWYFAAGPGAPKV